MRPLVLFLAASGLLVGVAALRLAALNLDFSGDTTIAVEEIPEIDEQPAAVKTVAPSRQVDGTLAPVSGELERVAPREPLSPLAQPTNPADRGAFEDRLLYRPAVDAVGRITASGHTLLLYGIEILELNDTCPGAVEWPCGVRARTAVRSWIRGRALTCNAPERPSKEPIVTRCSLGSKDVGQWIAENGWARVSADSPYVALSEAAQRAGRGIFGDGRRAPLELAAPPPDPVTEPLDPPTVGPPAATSSVPSGGAVAR